MPADAVLAKGYYPADPPWMSVQRTNNQFTGLVNEATEKKGSQGNLFAQRAELVESFFNVREFVSSRQELTRCN
jgi:hypothetical protein